MVRLFVIAVMTVGLIGCQVDPRPRDVGDFVSGRAATTDTAEYDGIYSLYSDQTSTPADPVLFETRLKKGEVVGFEIGPDHAAYAVAGGQKIKLNPGRFHWQMSPDPGQTDWHATDVVVIEVVVTVVVIAASVAITIAVAG